MKSLTILLTLFALPITTLAGDRPLPCEGHTIKPQICPRGQVCAPTQPPNVADLSGDCVLQSCGGYTREPRLCPDSQVCVYNHTLITDIPGRCLSAKLACGGGRGKASRRCKNGWQCVMNPQVDGSYTFEARGICVPPGALVVETPWRGWDAE